MKITRLMKKVNSIECNIDKKIDIKCLSMDSKESQVGGMFFCISGNTVDGHHYAEQSIKNGAIALVVERYLPIEIPQILVENSRQALASVCNNFYNIQDSILIAITGTNGKTTTTHIIKYLLEAQNVNVGIIGTNGIKYSDIEIEIDMTTPDTILLSHYIRLMKKAGITHIVMELSAHAIALYKVYGWHFEVSGITNITQDHLDFFGNMENYINAKTSFFNDDNSKYNIINIDDNNIAENINTDNVITISNKQLADYAISNIKHKKRYTQYQLKYKDKLYKIKTNMIGEYNIYNITMALSAIECLGYDISSAIKYLEKNHIEISGRSNIIKTKKGIIVIDYAHTPDGLRNILLSMKKLKHKRIVCLFGCGGNRDSSKRPIMADTVCNIADYAVITTDNPRYESPEEIINDTIFGIKHDNYTHITDRATAIEWCINHMKKGDILLICGKGNENYMDIKGIKYPYSDIEEVKRHL